MKDLLKIIIFIPLCASCTDNYDCRWKLKEDCRDSIKAYISSHKEYSSYLVVLKHTVSDQLRVITTGFLVGPLYRQSMQELHLPLPIVIENAKVFILSDLQLLMDVPEMSVSESDINSFASDYNKNEPAAVNFIRHAVYMYYNDSKLMVNTRPDTLFLPKIVEDEMIVEYENEL